MTDEELRKNVIECMRRAHFMDYAFIHGEEYVIKHRAWIEWEFERKLKRMTNAEWERVTKAYIELIALACPLVLPLLIEEGDSNDTNG